VNEPREEEGLASAVTEEVQRRAVDAALNFLSYRQRTAQEVERKLHERGFSEETIEAVIRRLSGVGLVDDEAFVGAFVRDRVNHRPMGVRRMADELYVKGIAREISLPAIEEMLKEEGTDERAMARRVAERKAKGLKARQEDRSTQRRRLRDHLLRRGFEPRIAQEAIDDWLPRG
jgi:regulatory protein